jgi:HAD superfamily hydrolase (TIGR01456 family)
MQVVAFLLDIDGVLVRGHNALPCAVPAIQAIEAAGERDASAAHSKLADASLFARLPLCFCDQLNWVYRGAESEGHRLDAGLQRGCVQDDNGSFVNARCALAAAGPACPHLFPLIRSLMTKPQHQRLLLVARSSSSARAIADDYGWTAVDTVQELAARQPQLYPSSSASKVGADCSHRAHSEPPYAAVVLLEMPANWGEAIQLLVDVLRGNGSIGVDCAQTIPFHCGNPDFDYKDVHSVPRMTLGAFRTALDALYTAATGRALVYTLHGKPHPATYELALETLKEQLHGAASLSSVICVGDNPASDIQGANGMGGLYTSVLVKTGVWQGEAAASASQVPWKVYGDVLECVRDVLAPSEHAATPSSS